MTFRAKPVVKRSRHPWERNDRRNLLTNLGFGLVVVVAVLLLVVYAAVSWYNDHLAPVASVNGQTLTRDDYLARLEIESARFQIALRRLDDERNAGRLTAEQHASQQQLVQQQAQQLQAIVYERMIDGLVIADLASQEGVTISGGEVDAQITKEATLPEQRRAWVIEVEPEVDEEAEEPTAAQKAAAKAKAEEALADIEGGQAWDEVARAVSTGSTKAAAGDLGWITAERNLDQAFVDALFALEANGMTGVLEGEDGVFRIGRVTEVAPERVIGTYQDELEALGIDLTRYREVVHSDLLGEKLREEVTSRATGASTMREVKEIFIQGGDTEALPTGSVKTRHILYAPKDDPSGAAQVPADDPAWKEAEDAARAAYAKLQDDISQFDAIAREESDEGGAESSGGKLPYFDPSMGQAQGGDLDQAFADAIFKEGLAAGDLLEPVKSGFGWHVIQVMYYPPDIDQANKLKAELEDGADFGQLARDFSDGEEAADGGDLGWVARLQLPAEREEQIFAAPVGEVSEPAVVEDSGIYLYLVTKEETREPDSEQQEILEAEAFSNWYAAKRELFNITRDVDFAATTG